MGKINNIEYVDINDLIPYANNTKVHPKKQLEKIADSIREFGFISPVLIDENNNIIAGHGRVLASKTIKIEKIPCVRVDGLTEEQRKAYVIADNKLSELGTWNKELVASEFEILNKKLDASITGFSLKDIRDIVLKPTLLYGAERDRTDKAYNLHLMSRVDVEQDFWQMPKIQPCEVIPDRLIGFNYAKTSEEHEAGIHFFVDDYQFERVWNEPEKYIDVLDKFDCILSPDFSLYADMPMPMKIWNVYRSRVIGAFYQSCGMNVIPTISWCEKQTYDFCFEGIEQGSTIAVSTVGIKRSKEALEIWVDGMNEAIRRIKPKSILVYGGKVDEYDFGDIQVFYFDNEVTQRWKREQQDD